MALVGVTDKTAFSAARIEPIAPLEHGEIPTGIGRLDGEPRRFGIGQIGLRRRVLGGGLNLPCQRIRPARPRRHAGRTDAGRHGITARRGRHVPSEPEQIVVP